MKGRLKFRAFGKNINGLVPSHFSLSQSPVRSSPENTTEWLSSANTSRKEN